MDQDISSPALQGSAASARWCIPSCPPSALRPTVQGLHCFSLVDPSSLARAESSVALELCHQPLGKGKEDISGIFGGLGFFRDEANLILVRAKIKPFFLDKKSQCTGSLVWHQCPYGPRNPSSWPRQSWWDICMASPDEQRLSKHILTWA